MVLFYLMTLSPNSPRSVNDTVSDLDVNSLLNNREFHEMLQDYFQSNTMTLDQFLENLPRFMMENYGDGVVEGDDDFYDSDILDLQEDVYYSEDEEEFDTNEDQNFIDYLRRINHRAQPVPTPLDPSLNLFRSLLVGQRELREIPLQTIYPQSPPPSPLPNLATQRSRAGPPLPARPNNLRRVPSQLRNSNGSVTSKFDPNGPEECKSPYNQLSEIAQPSDRNNNTTDLPMTREFMRRYGYENERISLSNNTLPALIEDPPER